jgi:hypothetical protein
MRTIGNQAGIEDESGSVRLHAAAEALVDDVSRLLLAATAAAADGKPALHFEQRARAAIHSLADLSVGYCMTDADVHGLGRSVPAMFSGRNTLFANKNDCQLYILG